MIVVDIRPMGSESSVLAVDAVGRQGYYGAAVLIDDGTNTTSTATSFTTPMYPRTEVDRTFEFAVGRYENLLRRLAD